MKFGTLITICIPCYNEFERFKFDDFKVFLIEHPEVHIMFINDASKDDTLSHLKNLQSLFKKRVEIIQNKTNLGKAESVRKGILKSAKTSKYVAYLDADLATSLEECLSMALYLNKDKEFVFASRILKIGSIVERKFSRFLVGRFIATIISSLLDLKVYDTQCGCKLFKSNIAQEIFKEKFISKWLFDVELFYRFISSYGKEKAITKMEEIPVKKWIDEGGSKVSFTYFFKLWFDLYAIWRMTKKSA